MVDILIKKIDDERLVIETTEKSEELVKKSSLELRRADLIIKHISELKEIDDLLEVFK